MNESRNATAMEKPMGLRYQGAAFVILAALFAMAALAPTLLLAGIGLVAGLSLAGYLVFEALEGRADLITLSWVFFSPIGYYAFSFPRDQAIVTLDRVTVLLMAVALIFFPQARLAMMSRDLITAGFAWIGFLLGALLSLVAVAEILTPFRIWFDGFVLPAVFAWFIITCFPVRKYLRGMHILACLAAVYSALIGLAEVALGRDLLELPGAGDTFAGTRDVLVLRVNGPYSSNNSFGLIGLVGFCLIWFLRSVLKQNMPRWQRALNAIGIMASLIDAMLPLFRSIFVTIALIIAIDLFRGVSLRQKVLRLGVLGLMGTAVLAVMSAVPELFQERVSDAGNIYARMAQQKQNFQLFLNHPVLGVGLYNFNTAAISEAKARVSYDDVAALDYPHSNVGAVLAETGLAGFVPYVISNALLFLAFWRLRRRDNDGKLAWTFFLYVFLSYWISGLALTSGYYSDLNLWYMFSIAVMYKFAVSKETVVDRSSVQS